MELQRLRRQLTGRAALEGDLTPPSPFQPCLLTEPLALKARLKQLQGDITATSASLSARKMERDRLQVRSQR